MNVKKKSQLRAIILELEEIVSSEAQAIKRHSNAGEDHYADHAAWCVEGINEAIMLIKNRFIGEGLGTLQFIVESTPGNLKPWKVVPAQNELQGLCADGACNHAEHI